MHTVIARFHHQSRELDRLESDLVRAGADDAQITGYTVALTFRGNHGEQAADTARHALDRIGATGIKINRPRPGRPQNGSNAGSSKPEDREADEEVASLMAKIDAAVYGHP